MITLAECSFYSYNGCQINLQDDLLAELKELETEELEADLLEVGEPSKPLDIGDPIDELPEVRKCLIIVPVMKTLLILLRAGFRLVRGR